MAFPFVLEENYEDAQGNLKIASADIPTYTAHDGMTDTDGNMTVEHFSELAKIPGMGMPYSGAYALRAEMKGGTNPIQVNENDGFDVLADAELYVRIMFWFGGPTLSMENNDIISIFYMESSGPSIEVTAGVQYTTANGYRVFVNETVSATGAIFADLTTNEWHCLELHVNLDDGASNDGAIEAWLDGASFGSVTSLDQGAIIRGRIGISGNDASVFGTVLYDSIISDDARIYPPTDRFVETIMLTKSGHAMLGTGTIKNATLLPSASDADNALELFDTNTGDVTDFSNNKLTLYSGSTAAEVIDPAGVPVHCRRGAYIKLSGTAGANGPRAVVQICPDAAYGSEGAIRNYGLRS